MNVSTHVLGSSLLIEHPLLPTDSMQASDAHVGASTTEASHSSCVFRRPHDGVG